MYPFIQVTLGFYQYIGSAHATLAFLLFILTLAASNWVFRKSLANWRTSLIVVVITTTAIIGARVFHVFWERPEYFFRNPSEIFTNWDGLVFYGAFFTGELVLLLMARKMIAIKKTRYKFYDFSAVILAISYAILRIGCFMNGCCWGRLTDVPWSVVYKNSNSVMPYLGLPVHPVQLYDAGIGVLLTLFLLCKYVQNYHGQKTGDQGKLILYFCLIYPVIRFFTEFYRGDSFRGVDLIWGLSTSQIISISLFSVSLCFLIYWETQENIAKPKKVNDKYIANQSV
jgi:phosphatidylglycerol---prolipoprotein diacylglyceryl transferase